jgi:hypothetical protein
MSDTIGRITVPTVINSGQTFPLTTQYPFGFSIERPVIVHRFGSLDAKQEQRYYVGIGPRKFQFKRPNLGWTEANQLKVFWESMQGPWKAFTYTVPNPDGTTTGVLVTFEQTPISFEYLRNAVQVGLNLIEVVDPTQAPTYAVNSTCLRFPSTALSTALLSEVQQIVPLVHIRVRESAVPDIYLSDRRVTVGGQLHLPRLIEIGEPGSDVLISQDIKGTSYNVRFTFGDGEDEAADATNPGRRSYECAQIVGPDSTSDVVPTGSFQFQRMYPGVPAGQATFETIRCAHLKGIRFYKLDMKIFGMPVKKSFFRTPGLPARMEVTLPSACIVAVLVAVANHFGYGPITVFPQGHHSEPLMPGDRTCSGGAYTFQIAGALAAQDNVAIPMKVHDPA